MRSLLLGTGGKEELCKNEQDVVELFTELAAPHFGLKNLRFDYRGFPDCSATKGAREVRIELEYESRNFLRHRHQASQCDWVVCWIDNCPEIRAELKVIEPQRIFGLGFNVWIQASNEKCAQDIAMVVDRDFWSVAKGAHQGDLLLGYRASPYRCLGDIFVLESDVKLVAQAEWSGKPDYMADIRRVCALLKPIHLHELKMHFPGSNFVRQNMQGRICATDHWPKLHQMIIASNPQRAGELAKFL